MTAKFPESHPEAIWIVGNFLGDCKTYLSFNAVTEDRNIVSGYVDMNQQPLDLFDMNGFKVWLQVEPANDDMITLIDLVLNQYKHHPSVIGFGVDVEWYKSDGSPLGTPITDEEAEAWVKAIRAHNPNYKLFLKHWEIEYMPPTYRDGVVFINAVNSLNHLKIWWTISLHGANTLLPSRLDFNMVIPPIENGGRNYKTRPAISAKPCSKKFQIPLRYSGGLYN